MPPYCTSAEDIAAAYDAIDDVASIVLKETGS
jgi:adenosylmethionine-8-amino-7-oxononanoate aminotransferase